MKPHSFPWAQAHSGAAPENQRAGTLQMPFWNAPPKKGHRARELTCLLAELIAFFGMAHASIAPADHSTFTVQEAVGVRFDDQGIIRLVDQNPSKTSSFEDRDSTFHEEKNVQLLAPQAPPSPHSDPPFYAVEKNTIVRRHWPLGASRLFDFAVFPNCLDEAELMDIPGIGAASASKIIFHRAANGDFESLQSMGSVRGIGPTKIQHLKQGLGDHVSFQACSLH